MMRTSANYQTNTKERKTMNRLLALTLASCISLTAIAQESSTQQPPVSNGSNLGGTILVAGKYTTLNAQAAGFLEVRGGITLNDSWTFGLGGAGLYYDKKLSSLVSDGTYHLYAAYGGIYVERSFWISPNFKGSVSLLTGQGKIYYQYDNDYRKEKVWTEEIIDETTFAVLEPGVTLQYRVGENVWLGLTASYRSTSPIRLLNTSESLLRNGSAGLTFSWDVF